MLEPRVISQSVWEYLESVVMKQECKVLFPTHVSLVRVYTLVTHAIALIQFSCQSHPRWSPDMSSARVPRDDEERLDRRNYAFLEFLGSTPSDMQVAALEYPVVRRS